MIRSELCSLVGLSVSEFNDHLHAGDLPFVLDGPGEVSDSEGAIWSNFSLDHAARLIAAKELVEAGLNWSESARLLREPWISTRRGSAGRPDGSYWVMRAERRREGGGEPDFAPARIVYAGRLYEIMASAQEQVEAYNRDSARTAYQKISLVSLLGVDLARARRLSSQRAEEQGLVGEQTLRVDPDADVPDRTPPKKQVGWRRIIQRGPE